MSIETRELSTVDGVGLGPTARSVRLVASPYMAATDVQTAIDTLAADFGDVQSYAAAAEAAATNAAGYASAASGSASAASASAVTSAGNAAASSANAAAAAASAITAANSEAAAQGYAASAFASDASASGYASAAAVSAAAAASYAGGWTGTSATSVAIGTGSKSFTASTGKLWVVGTPLFIPSNADSTNFMHGTVTAYDPGTGALTVNVGRIGGFGTHSDWNISLSGPAGVDGSTGGGDVLGPGTHADNYIPQWNGPDTKTLKAGIDPATLLSTTTFTQQLARVLVSKEGSDANSGLKPYLPKLTIGSALTAAAALIVGGITSAVVNVMDGGTYTENLAIPANVTVLAQGANLVGSVTLDKATVLKVKHHYSNGSNTQVVETITSSGETSFYEAEVLDGRGLAGTDTDNQCIRNGTSGRVFMAKIGKLHVPEGGEGVRDGTGGGGFGHIHFNIRDLYLAGNNARGIVTNNATTWIIGYVDHILKEGTPTGTVGIDMNDANSIVSITATEIKADAAYTITAGSLYLNCQNITGTRTGTPAVVGGWSPTAADRLLYGTAANATAETSFTAYGRTLVGLADATALAGQVDSFFLTPTEGNAAYQPLDSDLTSIAALTTTSYGRSLLTLADAAAFTAAGNSFTTALKGLAPASGGGTTNYLRADGSWADPVPNDSITYAKIQNVSATDKLLGRSTAGAGDVEEVPCTAAGRALIDDADAAAQRVTLGAASLPGARALSGTNNVSFLTTRMDFTADLVVLRDSAGSMFLKAAPGTLTCNISTAGPAANGRDQAGAFSASSWVHFWWIGKTDGTIATVASTSSTAPTLPSGYTHYAYICAVWFNGSSQLVRVCVAGNRVFYASGVGDALFLNGGTSDTETSVSLSSVIPPNAGDFQLNVMANSASASALAVSLRIISTLDIAKLWVIGNVGWADASPILPNRSQTMYYQNTSTSLVVYLSIIYYSVPNGST